MLFVQDTKRRLASVRHNPLSQVLLFLFVVPIFGTVGYMVIEGWNLMDSLYMSVITLSTIGYREVNPLNTAGKIFTMIFIILGVGTAFYSFTLIAETVVESGIILKKIIQLRIRRMEHHYIVCGYGKTGKRIVKELLGFGKKFVVIEIKELATTELRELNLPFLVGDASSEELLLKAGIDKAAGLVTALDTDAANVFVTLTARTLNDNLHIVARAEEISTESKLKKAGANAVLSPYEIGAQRLTHLLMQQNFVDSFELVTKKISVDISVVEFNIVQNHWICGKTLSELCIRQEFNAIIIALEKPTGEIEFPPNPKTQLIPGMIITAAATSADLIKLNHFFDLFEEN